MRLGVLTLAFAFVACDRGTFDRTDGTAPAFSRDSAGITIVENPPSVDADVPRWFVDTLPSLGIGSMTGDTAAEFTSVGRIAILPGGLIAVLDGRGETAFEFRIFDSIGRHVVTHGRQGEGPGEFRWVAYFGPAGGDTIVAVDFPNRRLNWLTISRGYVRSIRLDEIVFKQLVGDNASGTVETLIPFGDSLYAIKAFRRAPGNDPSARSNSFHIVDLPANRAIDLATFDEPRGVPVTIGGRSTMAFPVEPGAPVHVVDPARKRICAGITSVAEIRCVDSEDRRTIIRWQIGPVPFTAVDREATEERLRGSLTRMRQFSDRDVNTYLGAIQWPSHWTLFSVLQLDPDGNFWILEKAVTATGARESRFRILGSDGRHIAFANAFDVRNVGIGARTFIGSNAVLRLVEGADGTPIVAVFRMHKDG